MDRGKAETSRDRMGEEQWMARWGRRLITFCAYPFALTVTILMLPLAIPLALATDTLRQSNLGATRCLLAVTYYLICEILGLLASFALWLLFQSDSRRSLQWHFSLQVIWARALWCGMQRLFQLRLEITGENEIREDGPVLVFMRHASILDTLLPAVFLSHRHGLRLRYVLKRELLWDPCLDVVGQRLPNVFVRRGSTQSVEAVEAVRNLAAEMKKSEGLLIYPEGTRFTEAKREKVLAALDRLGDTARLESARELISVLPPRRGGPLALLDSRRDASVLFFAHFGFEGAASVRQIMDGVLVGRTLRIHFWRVPAGSIPAQEEERGRWLDAQWKQMDAWVRQAAAGQDRETACRQQRVVCPLTSSTKTGENEIEE